MTVPVFLKLVHTRRSGSGLERRIPWMAAEAGLEVASITTAESFPGLSEHLANHIEAGHVKGFDWFDHERARIAANPTALMPSARSIVSVGIPYWSGQSEKPDDLPRGRISRYAWGDDYHEVIKTRMRLLHQKIEREVGRTLEARFLVDTARIVDRAVAARAGLGWYGKHSCLIVPGHGSWVMLGDLLLDIELEPSEPLVKHCGRCTICLDRCPTGAIVAPYTVDSPRCISFQTIEQRGSIPHELRSSMGDWVFGCDVCQDVCPYTLAAKPVDDPAFPAASRERDYPSLAWLLSMSESEFRSVYRRSAVLRTKRRGLARNAAVALGNSGQESTIPILISALGEHDEPLVRGHAAWSLARLGGSQARTALEGALPREHDESARFEIISAIESV